MEHKHGLIKKLFASRVFLLTAVVILIILGIAYLRAYYQNYQIQAEIKQMLEESGKLENKNAELRGLLERVKQNDYVEEKARTELGLIKAGENETIILGNHRTASSSGQTESAVLESAHPSNPQQWWNYFFNHK